MEQEKKRAVYKGKSIIFLMLYFIDDLNKNNTKLVQQMKAAENLGFNVYYIGVDGNCFYLCNRNEKRLIIRGIKSRINLLTRIQMCISMMVILRKGMSFDYAYIRRMTPTISFGKAIKKLKKGGSTTIVEIPTYPPNTELQNDRRFFHRIFDAFYNKIEPRYSKFVDLYLAIGEHCNNYLGVRAINIENGIDINAVSKWTHTPMDKEVHFIALANFCYWHGYERVIDGLHEYYSNRDENDPIILVHFVGPDEDGSLLKWREQGEKMGIDNYLRFEGKKYGKELDEVFNKCDCAIASVGGHKKGLKTDSSLKSLNYLARGIPFIHAGTSFESDEINNYLYKVPANDEPIEFDKVLAFLTNFKSSSKASEKLREYCELNCSWEKQIIKALIELDN